MEKIRRGRGKGTKSGIDWNKFDPIIIHLRNTEGKTWAKIAAITHINICTVQWRAKSLNLVMGKIKKEVSQDLVSNEIKNRKALPAGHPTFWKMLWPNGSCPSYSNLNGPKP